MDEKPQIITRTDKSQNTNKKINNPQPWNNSAVTET